MFLPDHMAPRKLGEPGPRTCGACEHYALTPTQSVPVCIKRPPTVAVVATPRVVPGPDGQPKPIMELTRITSYPEPKPFESCDGFKPRSTLQLAKEMPR